jgi:hypothetical protein
LASEGGLPACRAPWVAFARSPLDAANPVPWPPVWPSAAAIVGSPAPPACLRHRCGDDHLGGVPAPRDTSRRQQHMRRLALGAAFPGNFTDPDEFPRSTCRPATLLPVPTSQTHHVLTLPDAARPPIPNRHGAQQGRHDARNPITTLPPFNVGIPPPDPVWRARRTTRSATPARSARSSPPYG